MSAALQRCYPSSLILKPTAEASCGAVSSPTLVSDIAREQLASNAMPPHQDLAFVSGPATHRKPCSAAPNAPPSQGYQDTATTDARASGTALHVSSQGGTEEDQQKVFSACLRNSAWSDALNWSEVTVHQIYEASAVLMAHWQSSVAGLSFIPTRMHPLGCKHFPCLLYTSPSPRD